jgi:hypothetical protein
MPNEEKVSPLFSIGDSDRTGKKIDSIIIT